VIRYIQKVHNEKIKLKVEREESQQRAMQREGTKYHDEDSFFSVGGDNECLDAGDLDDSLPLLEGGEIDLASMCILSSLWFVGEGAVDVGDNVAIGGSAIEAEALFEWPAPIGRGWGGRTTGREGLGGN